MPSGRKPALHVDHGAAVPAVWAAQTKAHRPKDLDIFERHPEQRADPHPEDGARPSGEQRTGNAGNVACAKRGGEGGRGSFKGGNAAAVALTGAAKEDGEGWKKPANLHEPGLPRKIGARCEQQQRNALLHAIPPFLMPLAYGRLLLSYCGRRAFHAENPLSAPFRGHSRRAMPSGPGGYAPAEWRLASTGPAHAARPAPADMRLLNGASHPPARRMRRVRPPADMRPGSLKEAREKMTVRRKPQVRTDETG